MNRLKINRLLIDERSFSFQPGINVIVGANATGKTTIFKSIKHGLGLSVDLSSTLFHHIELAVTVGLNDYIFTRESGSASVHVHSDSGNFTFRARSALLDEFFQDIFRPNFAIGNRLISMLPILDFSFLSDESRLNSRSLSSTIRLICGANDKLIETASKDINLLRTQIQEEETFLLRIEAFLDDFLQTLGKQPDKIEEKIKTSLAIGRNNILNPLLQKREIFEFSIARVSDLIKQNEIRFSASNREIESSFLSLISSISDRRLELIKLENVIARDIGRFSYGESVLADFIMLLSIARTSNFTDLNFPKLYINDGMCNSLDNNTLRKLHNLIEVQARDDEEFQYIEFSAGHHIPNGFLVTDLSPSRKESRI